MRCPYQQLQQSPGIFIVSSSAPFRFYIVRVQPVTLLHANSIWNLRGPRTGEAPAPFDLFQRGGGSEVMCEAAGLVRVWL